MDVSRIIGPGGQGTPEPLVAGEAETDASVLAGFVGDGGDASLGGQLSVGPVAPAVVAELGENLGSIDGPGTRKGSYDLAVGMLSHLCGDESVELLDLGDDGRERRGEASHELSPGFGFQGAGMAGGRLPEPGEQSLDRPSATIGVRLQEALEPLGAEPCGALRGGIARDEGQGDRAVDVGEDRHSAGPKALEQAPELIGQSDPGGDEIVAGADQGPQRPGGIRRSPELLEPMTIGSQQVGQQVRITRIALAASGGVARPAGFDLVGVNRYDLEVRLNQRVHEQAGRTLDSDPQPFRRFVALEPAKQPGESLGCVGHLEAAADLAAPVDHADVMLLTRPIEAREVRFSGSWHGLPPCLRISSRSGVRRSGRSLIVRRSGLFGAVAQHPVVGLGLPRRVGERVSHGPSDSLRGKRTWLSPPGRRSLPDSSNLPSATFNVDQ
jgi:hypothetical protein